MKPLNKVALFFRDIKHVWLDWHSGFHAEEDRLLRTYYEHSDAVMAQMGGGG